MGEEVDIKEIISLLWKKKSFIIVVTILISLITFILFSILNNVSQNIENAQNSEKLYYAETHFIVGTSETTNATFTPQISDTTSQVNITEMSRITQNDILLETYRELLKSKTSLNRIIDELELDIDSNHLSSLIAFSRVSESDFLSLTVAYKDKDKVIQITKKIMDEFINNMSKAYSMDKVSIIDEAYLLSDFDIANSATAPQIITSHSIAKSSLKVVIKNTIIAGLIGFIMSASIVLIRELFDPTIKSKQELEKLTNCNVFVTINKNKINNYNHFALLRVRLEEAKTILVTTPEPSRDLTYISNNLAHSFSKSLNKVLLLNLGFDEDVLVKKYSLKSLLESISNKNSDMSKIVIKSACGAFDVLYIDSDSNAYLNASQLKKLINSFEKLYDVVIINSDNILENAHGLAISKIIKNTLIVADERTTKASDFLKVMDFIKGIKEYIWLK